MAEDPLLRGIGISQTAGTGLEPLGEADGSWQLLRFRIGGFEVLVKDSLREAVATLRAVPGNGWKEIEDPLAELEEIRRGDVELRH